MNLQFTDEMKLIIENWDVVRDIRSAEDALAHQLVDTLHSLEGELIKQPWWNNSWKFERYQDTQSFISHREWNDDGDPLIWIGVENFTVKSVFGDEGFALLYVWVPKLHKDLISNLRSKVQNIPDITGDVDTRPISSYIIRQPLRKCLPEELDRFEEIIIDPIIEFMTFYAAQKDFFSNILITTKKPGDE